jgi:hypothetical protein
VIPEDVAALVHGSRTVTIGDTDTSGLVLLLPDRAIVRGALDQDGRLTVPAREWIRGRLHRILASAVWGLLGFGAGAAFVAFIGR